MTGHSETVARPADIVDMPEVFPLGRGHADCQRDQVARKVFQFGLRTLVSCP